jgi:hypothetical protein
MNARRFASLAGALVVATIAALASYSHMRSLALQYGQSELIADLLPISVDGMMAVATVALSDGRRNRATAWLAFWTGVGASVAANVLAAEPSTVARCISAWPAVAFVLVVEVITRGGRIAPPSAERNVVPAPQSMGDAPAPTTSSTLPRERRRKTQNRVRRPVAQTRELVANLRAQDPAISQAELARQLGISATRLRQVAREEASAPIHAGSNS